MGCAASKVSDKALAPVALPQQAASSYGPAAVKEPRTAQPALEQSPNKAAQCTGPWLEAPTATPAAPAAAPQHPAASQPQSALPGSNTDSADTANVAVQPCAPAPKSALPPTAIAQSHAAHNHDHHPVFKQTEEKEVFRPHSGNDNEQDDDKRTSGDTKAEGQNGGDDGELRRAMLKSARSLNRSFAVKKRELLEQLSAASHEDEDVPNFVPRAKTAPQVVLAA